MATLGGYMAIHNAVEFDYCIVPAVRSLAATCDDVVVLDCQSTDGTLELLQSVFCGTSNVRIIPDGHWDPTPGMGPKIINEVYDLAASHLSTDWRFMLHADEVIHERSIPIIRDLIESTSCPSIRLRRINFFKDSLHYIPEGSPYKPVPTENIRIGKPYFQAINDADSIGTLATNPRWCGDGISPETDDSQRFNLEMHHYAFIRDPAVHNHKIQVVQTWYYKTYDRRIEQCPDIFDPEVFIPSSALEEWKGTSPIFAKEWLEARNYPYIPYQG